MFAGTTAVALCLLASVSITQCVSEHHHFGVRDGKRCVRISWYQSVIESRGSLLRYGSRLAIGRERRIETSSSWSDLVGETPWSGRNAGRVLVFSITRTRSAIALGQADSSGAFSSVPESLRDRLQARLTQFVMLQSKQDWSGAFCLLSALYRQDESKEHYVARRSANITGVVLRFQPRRAMAEYEKCWIVVGKLELERNGERLTGEASTEVVLENGDFYFSDFLLQGIRPVQPCCLTAPSGRFSLPAETSAAEEDEENCRGQASFAVTCADPTTCGTSCSELATPISTGSDNAQDVICRVQTCYRERPWTEVFTESQRTFTPC